MAASSADASAPETVIRPAKAQARNNQPGAPTSRADSADVMKMPDPIIEPTTIIVASSKLSPRSSFAGCVRVATVSILIRSDQYLRDKTKEAGALKLKQTRPL